MTPTDFKAFRQSVGMTQRQVADYLQIGDRHVRMIEAGDRAISGPIALLMEQLSDRTRLRTQLNTRTEALEEILAALEGNEKPLAVKLRAIAEEALK